MKTKSTAPKQGPWPAIEVPPEPVALPRLPPLKEQKAREPKIVCTALWMRRMERDGLLVDIGRALRGDLIGTVQFINLAMRIAGTAEPKFWTEDMLGGVFFIGNEHPLGKVGLRKLLARLDDAMELGEGDASAGLEAPMIRAFNASRLARAREAARKLFAVLAEIPEALRATDADGGPAALFVLDEDTWSPVAVLGGFPADLTTAQIAGELPGLGLAEGFEAVRVFGADAAEATEHMMVTEVLRTAAERLLSLGAPGEGSPAALLALFIGAGLRLSMEFTLTKPGTLPHSRKQLLPTIRFQEDWSHIRTLTYKKGGKKVTERWIEGPDFIGVLGNAVETPDLFARANAEGVRHLLSVQHVADVLVAGGCGLRFLR